MKVKCINSNGYWLTIDNIYDVIKDGYNYYLLRDNQNYKWWYPKEYFKLLSEVRNEKINKLLEWK